MLQTHYIFIILINISKLVTSHYTNSAHWRCTYEFL